MFTENLSESLKHFVYHMIQYYDENSRKDDVYTITTRKHLLPHVNSFLQLIKTNEDMRNVGNSTVQCKQMFMSLIYCTYVLTVHIVTVV